MKLRRLSMALISSCVLACLVALPPPADAQNCGTNNCTVYTDLQSNKCWTLSCSIGFLARCAYLRRARMVPSRAMSLALAMAAN